MRKIWGIAGFALALTASSALALSNYTYGEQEYVTITNGTSPKGTYSIAAHGVGEDSGLAFGLFLMGEKGRKVLDPLDEIDDVFETDANAYTASWSPDEQYVALSYRIDRHVSGLRLYRIVNGEGEPVDLPFLVEEWRAANLGKDEAVAIPSLVASLEWRDAKHILIRERGVLKSETDGTGIAGHLARLGTVQQSEDDGRWMVDFTLEAEGELSAGGIIEITTPVHAISQP